MVCRNGDGWGDSGVSQWDRIKPALGEGMAARKAPQSQPGAFKDAKPNQRNIGILRTSRKVQALRRAEGMKHRRQDRRVETIDAADGEAGWRVWHRHEAGGRFSACFCFSAVFWIARKTLATSRSSVANSRSMTLRRG